MLKNLKKFVHYMGLDSMRINGHKYFNIDSIKEIFTLFGENLRIPVHGLLIGGGTMGLKGIKDATKDVDLVIMDDREYNAFLTTAIQLGFQDMTVSFPAYHNLKTKVLVNEDEFHIDLFSSSVCGKLTIHDGMMKRSEHIGSFGILRISLMSNEDLLIAKSVTGRDRDLEDMYSLYLRELDENIIIGEMNVQDECTERNWEAFMVGRLDALEGWC